MDNQTILHSYKQALERKDLKGALVQTGKVWPAGRGEEAGELHNGRCCSYTLNTRFVRSVGRLARWFACFWPESAFVVTNNYGRGKEGERGRGERERERERDLLYSPGVYGETANVQTTHDGVSVLQMP